MSVCLADREEYRSSQASINVSLVCFVNIATGRAFLKARTVKLLCELRGRRASISNSIMVSPGIAQVHQCSNCLLPNDNLVSSGLYTRTLYNHHPTMTATAAMRTRTVD